MSDDLDISLRRGHEPADNVVLRRTARGRASVLHQGRRFALGPEGLLIGRAPECDLVLENASIEPRHARIDVRGNRFELSDLDSRIGTYLNGERFVAATRPLTTGDGIAIGDEVLHFLALDDTPLPPVEVPTATSQLRMDRHTLSIGRDATNDIVLDHPTVSPIHAEIVAGPNGVRLKDLSRGGTGIRVNGTLVARTFLKTGDEIAIGPYRLVFDGALLQQRSTGAGIRLDAEGVRVDVGQRTILQPATLNVVPGELVAVIGESGAGKSTLLKALAGIHRPTAGRVMLDGEPIAARLSDVGYVPQDEIVHPLLTVREALGYAAELRLPQDTPAADRDAAVAAVIAHVGLEESADVRIGSLSGGQRKRAGVAAELIDEPGLLFLDEPTTGLDAGLEHRLMRLFRSLADAGRAVMLVTHATRSLRLCDKVVVMGRGGLLCFDGSPDDALAFFGVDHFDDLYVALDERGAEHWHARFSAGREQPAARESRPPRAAAPVRSLWPQAMTLTRRYAKVFGRDRRNLTILAGQVPLLALATALLFKGDVFARDGDPRAGESAQLLFLLVTVAVWFGVIASAREIVKERAVVQRESAVGVRSMSYIASKALLLFALTGVQTIVFALLVLGLRPLHEPGAMGSVLWVLVLTAWTGVAMGLLISLSVRSEDQAASFIPLVLIPQLLFGGGIVPVAQMGEIVALLSKLITAQWGYAGVGTAVDLQARIDSDPVFGAASRYGDSFFDLPAPAAAAVLGLFLVAAGFILTGRLRAFCAEGRRA